MSHAPYRVSSVGFSPDGSRRAAAGGVDAVPESWYVRVWEAAGLRDGGH